MLIFICSIVISLWLWVLYEAENAPLLTDDGDIVYKDYVTYFGIKIKKRKNK